MRRQTSKLSFDDNSGGGAKTPKRVHRISSIYSPSGSRPSPFSIHGADHKGDTVALTSTSPASMLIEEEEPDVRSLAQPSRKYRFQLETHPSQGAFIGKSVKWIATSDKPIESLLYPSLHQVESKLKLEQKLKEREREREREREKSPHNGFNLHAFRRAEDQNQHTEDFTRIPVPQWKAEIADNPHHVKDGDESSLLKEIHELGASAIVDGIKSRFRQRRNVQDKLLNQISRKTKFTKLEEKLQNRSEVSLDANNYLKNSIAVKASDAVYADVCSHLLTQEARTPVSLSKRNPNELAHHEAKKSVEKLVPKEDIFTTEGLMYYRIKNILRSKELEEHDNDILLSETRAVGSPGGKASPVRLSKRMSTFRLLQNQPNSQFSVEVSTNEQSIRSMDFELLNADFTRIRRAIHAQNVGYDAVNLLGDGSPAKGDIPAGVSPINAVNKRNAQDALLISQLRVDILPEPFIKKTADPNDTMLNLGHYGIGDEHAKCLGEGLSKLRALSILGLRNNRLSSTGIAKIVADLPCECLRFLDISCNTVQGQGCEALSEYFKRKNALEGLNMSKCQVRCADLLHICQSMVKHRFCVLKEWNLSDNVIRAEGVHSLGAYLVQPYCTIEIMDLSWNEVGSEGASALGGYLSDCVCLRSLNLSANALQDYGGQKIAAALTKNRILRELELSQNSIAGRTCFVFAKTLHGHPTMEKLHLNSNPLGEAGGRSIFRSILRGLKCMIMMRNCQFPPDNFLFNHSNPSEESPYTLDLADAYDAAVLSQLMQISVEESGNCRFQNVAYKENAKGRDSAITLGVKDGEVVQKPSGSPWIPPVSGIITVDFRHNIVIPSLEKAASPREMMIVGGIVAFGATELDKRNWFKLLTADIYCTTTQVDKLIEYFVEKNTIGLGGLTKLDVLMGTWNRLLDTANAYEFLCRHLDIEGRKSLVYALGFDRFKFCWTNPTGHWRLYLGDNRQRSMMLRLIAINNVESEYSRTKSRRGDTSQHGNWYNFRNGEYDGHENAIVIDKEFLSNLPYSGVLEFDYVSTTRPNVRLRTQKQKEAAATAAAAAAATTNANMTEDETAISVELPAIDSSQQGLTEEADGGVSGGGGVADESQEAEEEDAEQAAEEARGGEDTGAGSKLTELLPFQADLDGASAQAEVIEDNCDVISDEQFFKLIDLMGLTARSRRTGSLVMFSLMELQHAASKYYFPVIKVIGMLDYFTQDPAVQARLVICMFSRIWDLYNIDYLFRCISTEAQQIVFKCIGCLNIVNPLKPCLDFVLSLRYYDNRNLTHSLLEISASDGGDQINEDPHTELSVVAFYGSTQRLLNDTRPEILRLSFADVGERTLGVSWTMRRDQVRRYLVGTYCAYDREMYRIISMYKEMEKAGALGRGPIELQYQQYQKNRSQKTQGRGGPLTAKRSGL